MDVVALLDALAAAGLSVAIQDAVGVACGDAVEVPLSAVKSLLTGAGVGVAAAIRIVRQLVSGCGWLFMPTLQLGLGVSKLSCVSPLALLSAPEHPWRWRHDALTSCSGGPEAGGGGCPCPGAS